MRYYFLILFLFLISCNHYSIYTECKENTDKALIAWQEIEDFDYYFTDRYNSANLVIRKWKNKNSPLGIYYGHGVIDSIDDFLRTNVLAWNINIFRVGD